MACPSVETRKERSIKEPSEDSPRISVKEVRPIDVVQSLIELDILCFTLYSEEL
jgi:hypothetical protein